MRRRSVAAPVALLLTVGLVAACSSSKSNSGSIGSGSAAASSGSASVTSGGTVVIGDISSKSGQYSICPPSDVTLSIAIDEINAKGGVVVGNKSYKFKFDSLDDQSDTAKSSADARQLIQDGAKFVFGPCGSAAASVLQLTKASGAVLISPASSTAAAITVGGGNQGVLTALPSVNDREASIVAGVKQTTPAATKMVMLGADDPTWGAAVTSMTALWTKGGGTASSVLYPPGTSDLSGFLAKVKSANPDVLYIGENTQSVTLALQQLNAAGISKSVVIVGHGTDPALASQAGGRAYFAPPFSPGPLSGPGTNDATTTLVNKYYAATNTSTLPAYAPPIRYYYDIMYVLAAAMTKAGSVDDPKTILAQILGKNLNYTGALGAVTFTSDGFIRFPLVSTFVSASGTQTTTTWQPGS